MPAGAGPPQPRSVSKKSNNASGSRETVARSTRGLSKKSDKGKRVSAQALEPPTTTPEHNTDILRRNILRESVAAATVKIALCGTFVCVVFWFLFSAVLLCAAFVDPWLGGQAADALANVVADVATQTVVICRSVGVKS